jgi:hypothetical protein
VKAIRADLLDFTATPAGATPAMPGRALAARPLAAGRRRRPHRRPCTRSGARAGLAARSTTAAGCCCRASSTPMCTARSWTSSPATGPSCSTGWRRYTFPAERAWADPAVARPARRSAFSTPCWPTAPPRRWSSPPCTSGSADALFTAACARHALIAGKVLMDRHAPDGLRDDVAQAERDCVDLIQRWHGRGRCWLRGDGALRATSTPEQLAMAGAAVPSRPHALYMQTHVAENRDEVRWVASCSPTRAATSTSTTAHGLLHPRAVLAHGIWLDAHDRALLHDTGAQIAFCPSSATCSWAAACSTGRRGRDRGRGARQRGQRRGRRHQPVDAAHAGRRLQGAGAARHAPDGLGAAARGHARRGPGAGPGARDRHLGRARWPTWCSGTGRTARWPAP